jgi:CRISPR system Cascade subunit CasE
LHLVKVPLRADKFVAVARRRGLSARDFDEGYFCHCVLRELWQERAPAPFVVRGQGRTLDIWGYSRVDAVHLIDHARTFGDPSLLTAIDNIEMVVSKPMPRFETGRRVGFLLRACPIVRLARDTNGHRAGAEVDAFLARCFASDAGPAVSREDVYRDWLTAKLDQPATTGVKVHRVRIAAISRERLVRRSQGDERRARTLERPDVRFEGNVEVLDGDRFNGWLGHGVGRHRAFGFGALILVPPGTVHSA